MDRQRDWLIIGVRLRRRRERRGIERRRLQANLALRNFEYQAVACLVSCITPSARIALVDYRVIFTMLPG